MGSYSKPTFASSSLRSKLFFIVMLIAIAVLIVDSSVLRISIFHTGSDYNAMTITFTAISIITIATQYILLQFMKSKGKIFEFRNDAIFKLIHRAIFIIQYVLMAFLALLVIQVLALQYYNNNIVIAITAISYSAASILTGLLAHRFFSWFRSNRNKMILLYGLSSIIFSINMGLTVAFIATIPQDWQSVVRPHAGITWPTLISGSPAYVLNLATLSSYILSFAVTWVATTMLLRHHSKRIGNIAYWLIMAIPLVYFLAQFISLFQELAFFLRLDPFTQGFLFTVFFSLSKPVGGILFGFAFWDAARKIRQITIRDYIIISAYGLMFFFAANQAVIALAVTPWPAFGVSNILYIGLSSYLIYVGIYYSAISMAQDVKLRQSIRELAESPSLVESIGSAQMEQEIQGKIMAMLRKQEIRMSEESGIQSSLNDEDLKKYLDEVFKEIKDKKEDKKNSLS